MNDRAVSASDSSAITLPIDSLERTGVHQSEWTVQGNRVRAGLAATRAGYGWQAARWQTATNSPRRD